VQGFGGLILSDPAGEAYMFAGSQQDKGCNVGVVRVGPRGRPGTMGAPVKLQGVC